MALATALAIAAKQKSEPIKIGLLYAATALSDRADVLEKDQVHFSGAIAALQQDDEVRQQYLSVSEPAAGAASIRGTFSKVLLKIN